MPTKLEALMLRHLRLEQVRVLFEGFGEMKENVLKELKRVVLRHPDYGNAAGPIVELVRSTCGKAGVEVEFFDGKGEFRFYEAIISGELVERPAWCKNYPRNWDWIVHLMEFGSFYRGTKVAQAFIVQ
jgi:hypothetical protein